ncbi:hypothetical protein O3G_MSEX006172 [Manduca sexta]|uniref:Centromere protein L n=1 Tax=Manduca sexta TaxID=7130 RepID=A0A922CJX8_MANSE|nr:hypothetical protein O3G_MSEX006172 [Manduca sexta]
MPTYRQDSSCDQEDEANINYQATGDPLALIYNEGLWRIYKLSPLHNIQCTAVKLKQYASKVRQSLVSSTQMNSNLKYTVQFEEQPLRYSEDDANGLMITVSSSQENNSNKKVVYTAILLSWGMSINLENTTHLPYMLERGEQKIGHAVQATLKSAFDCNIKQFTFTQHQLLHFGYMFLENDTSRSNDPFTLVYRTPQSDVKDRLSMSFEVGDVRLIWNRVKDEKSETSEPVILAYQVLQNQIFEMTFLDVTVFELCELNLPKGEIKSSGAVKMKTPEIVNCFFTTLNTISYGNI